MTTNSESAINQKIVSMRKSGSYISTIHKWLIGWDNFSQLDEIVCLCHVCRVLHEANLAVSRNETRKCFNAFYNQKYHGDKKGYLNWIYASFGIKDGARVFTSQVRKKSPIPQTPDTKSGSNSHDFVSNGEICIKPHKTLVSQENTPVAPIPEGQLSGLPSLEVKRW